MRWPWQHSQPEAIPIQAALVAVWQGFWQNGIASFHPQGWRGTFFQGRGYEFCRDVLADNRFEIHIKDEWHSPSPWLDEAVRWYQSITAMCTQLMPQPGAALVLHWTRFGATGNMGIPGHHAVGKSDENYATITNLQDLESWLNGSEARSIRDMASNRGSLRWHILVGVIPGNW